MRSEIKGLVSKLSARTGAIYEFECVGPDGKVKWREAITNIIPVEGRNFYLDATLKEASQPTDWYVGLIDDTNWTEVASDDTAAKISTTKNHPTTNDWQELDDYSESTRPVLTLGTVASGSVDNSASKASYSINATVTIRGAFVVSSSVKGGTAGTLLSAGAFSSTRSAQNGDTLNVTVTLTMADDGV